MKKARVFVAVALLALVSAGVFAGMKAGSSPIGPLYYFNSSTLTYPQIGATVSSNPLVYYPTGGASGTQATIDIQGSVTKFGLYTYLSGTGFLPAY